MARNTVPLTIVGNLTDDPELRFTPSGSAVCRFTVAVNPRRFDRGKNDWVDEEPSFYRVTAWRQLAENIVETLAKGHRVVVAGDLRQRSWEDKADPSKRHYGWEVTADAVGPELSWAKASIKKLARASGGDVPPDDPFATASRTAPAGDGGRFDAEPPF